MLELELVSLLIDGRFIHPLPFVDDRLKQLLREKMMNIHWLVLWTTIKVLPNVHVLKTEAMNPSIGHMTILVNY